MELLALVGDQCGWGRGRRVMGFLQGRVVVAGRSYGPSEKSFDLKCKDEFIGLWGEKKVVTP